MVATDGGCRWPFAGGKPSSVSPGPPAAQPALTLWVMTIETVSRTREDG
jgi:hypothetical protein